MRQRKTNQCLAQIHISNPCVDIGDLWFKLFEPVSFCYYYVSDCNNDNNGNNKIQEIEKYRTGLKSFKPKNEICC